MFRRAHHQRVYRVLECLDEALLARTGCCFGGGTAIVLLLDEYRESVDIDLLCASHEGYRELRNTVSERSLGALLKQPVELARDVRTDRWADRSTASRDAIDLAMMVHHWGPVPIQAWEKVNDAYGPSARQALLKAQGLLAETAYLDACLQKMGMDVALAPTIQSALGKCHGL